MSEAEIFDYKIEMIKKINSIDSEENFENELTKIQNEHSEALDERVKRWREQARDEKISPSQQ